MWLRLIEEDCAAFQPGTGARVSLRLPEMVGGYSNSLEVTLSLAFLTMDSIILRIQYNKEDDNHTDADLPAPSLSP